MGKLGAEGILAEMASRGGGSEAGVRMLTHCNTGSLATAAYGTALGVVRALHAAGRLQHAFCTETRPYNQGAMAPTSLSLGNCSLEAQDTAYAGFLLVPITLM